MHQTHLCALRCGDALTTKGDDGIEIGSSYSDSSDIDPQQLRAAHQAWVLLVTACKGVALDIVQDTESPGEASSKLGPSKSLQGAAPLHRL